MLRFNQPVRADGRRRAPRGAIQPHPWQPPSFAPAERARLTAVGPGGSAAVRRQGRAGARRPPRARDALGRRVADHLGSTALPANGHARRGRDTTVPPPGAWLELTLDAACRARGTGRPPKAQTSIASSCRSCSSSTSPRCVRACDPPASTPVVFPNRYDATRLAGASRRRHHRSDARSRCGKTSRGHREPAATAAFHSLEDAGFDRQPPASTYALRPRRRRCRRSTARRSAILDRHRRELARPRVHELRRRPRCVGNGRRPAAVLLAQFPTVHTAHLAVSPPT